MPLQDNPEPTQASLIDIQPLTADSFRPYGWVLGQNIRLDVDFCHQHTFDPGIGGETEVLWVNYLNRQREVSTLEMHRLTQQAIVPLTGEIVQVVAYSERDGSVDIGSMRAFRVRVGEGICMRAGCWHTTRVDAPEVKCMMLTRRSTTIDLVAHLTGGSPLSESAMCAVDRKLRS
ncbi:MAG: ureidoglycolate lyase [Bryobacteraceae bacterium]